jgi:hypothetical protein
MVVAFTGHRPPKAKLSTSIGTSLARCRARQALRVFCPDYAIVGGALGFDTLAAEACVLEGIPFHVYAPCKNQDSRWPVAARKRYQKMLSIADRVVYTWPGAYIDGCLHHRNEAMVDNSHALLAWWDGSAGGTKHCINYAGGCINLYQPCVTWARYDGYEVTSAGDTRFSALFARLPTGETVEDRYQCGVKGFSHWRVGKGKPGGSWGAYLAIWEEWARHNGSLLAELLTIVGPNGTLSDRYATSEINQAHALAVLLNRLSGSAC